MGIIPAVCQNCGSIFNSGIYLGPGASGMLKGNKSGPCPVCGEMGIIPDGMYEVVNGIVNIFSIDDGKGLEDLKNALKQLNIEEASLDDINETVSSKTPQYIGLIKWLREFSDENKSIFNLITTLLAIMTFVQSHIGDDSVSDEDFMEIIQTQQEFISQQQSENEKLKEDVDELLENEVDVENEDDLKKR